MHTGLIIFSCTRAARSGDCNGNLRVEEEGKIMTPRKQQPPFNRTGSLGLVSRKIPAIFYYSRRSSNPKKENRKTFLFLLCRSRFFFSYFDFRAWIANAKSLKNEHRKDFLLDFLVVVAVAAVVVFKTSKKAKHKFLNPYLPLIPSYALCFRSFGFT